MYHSPTHSARNSGTLSEKYELGEPPIDSGSTLLPEAPRRPHFQSSTTLRWISFTLHSSLIAVHLVLAVVWSKGLQHRVVFSLEHQQIVSFVITAIMTAIGAIYSALLVYVTQTLSTRRSLRMDQTLMAIHDSAAAWSGIGAAVVYLWLQTSYQLCKLSRSLKLLPSIRSREYDPRRPARGNILQPNTGIGDVRVNATGFNVTCGYPAQMSTSPRLATTTVTEIILDNGSSYTFESTQPGLIVPLTGGAFPLLLYSTIPIVNSSNSHPPLLNITPPMNNSISYVQIVECHHTVVPQTVVLDAQSRMISKLEPDIRKSASTWSPYSGPTEPPSDPSNTTSGNYLIELWPSWYRYTPPSIFPLIPTPEAETKFISVMDLCLIQLLNLHDYQGYNPNSTVSLHDLENALSSLAAAMFWTRKLNTR
ncbi:hypothetical protein FB451DRAFT_1400408 [Mycena latifolia]|nr:hypothetical protein FB451DRAFT_1400408 [Mycena latifolia]